MHRSSFLLSLRASLLAALSLSASACGDDDDGQQIGAGGTAGASGASGAGGGTGGSGGSGGAGGGVAGSGVGGASSACQNPTPIVDEGGAVTGFDKCADGAIRRVTAVAANPAFGVKACTGTEDMVSCSSDAQCVEKPHGKCGTLSNVTIGGDVNTCQCIYPCANDAECGKGFVCVPSALMPSDVGTGSICAPATCTVGADCPSGECGVSAFDNGCGFEVQLACRSDADTCHGSAACQGTSPVCALPFSQAPNWQCTSPSCAIGRPLLVDGLAQTARPAERADWAAGGPSPVVDGIDDGLRAALARHWLDVAALEHASVASFARFTLELLGLGAPPGLIADAQRAGLDEIVHAEIAYSLASAYAGRRLGPGLLAPAGLTLTTDRREALRSLVHEACVGETLGVAEAHALAAAVDDSALGLVHARIAADEQRHAELAWRTLAWLLEGADEPMLRFAADCFDEAIAAAQDDPPAREHVARGHGLLSSSELGALRRQALREVIAPCAEALLRRGSASAARPPAGVVALAGA